MQWADLLSLHKVLCSKHHCAVAVMISVLASSVQGETWIGSEGPAACDEAR
jgi:hypothetical protein